MTLSAGMRIGPYEIVSTLGVGGMGEVYRAHDAKLQRDVAIKMLPDTFVSDRDRVVRFEREARTLAALNHPNIASIYGFEEGRALVLELVEGPTLADRLSAAPLPLDEALVLARQIADAVEAAHERGIIHRDLKPANIKVRHDGTVKVLDFGLAKLADAADESGTSGLAMSMSPTLSLPATQAGVILGTAAYMSPEQARGRGIDRRTDIWAFGCVLFEMLTGRRVFDAGDTISDAVAAVLKSEPDWTALPRSTPPRLRELLQRCLIKDPRRRLRDMGDARLTLEDLIAQPDTDAAASERPAALRSTWIVALPWTIAFLALAAVGVVWVLSNRPVDLAVTRLVADAGVIGTLESRTGPVVVPSPDGRLLAMIATMPGARPQMLLRPLTDLQARPLEGTDDARNPFFSPDGQWIAFFADGKLKKISVRGGFPIELSSAPDDRGGTWLDDHTIAFAPTPRSSLMSVPDGGGTPQVLTTLDKTAPTPEITHRWPHALPGARGVLFVASSVSNDYEDATISLHVMATGERKNVHRGGYAPRYATSGHLLFMHQARLFAKPFDLSRVQAAGEAVAFMEGVESTPANGTSQFALAANGVATYLARRGSGGVTLFMSTKGEIRTLGAEPSSYLNPAFSPDGRTLMLENGAGQYDLLSYDWARNRPTKLTFEPTQDASPVWSPSGRQIAFASQRGDKATFNIYWQNANGTGGAHPLTQTRSRQTPDSWHPDGRFLAFTETADGFRIRILPLEPDGAGWKATGPPAPFADAQGGQSQAAFSPDGAWLAYTSTELQRPEVFVRQFPSGDGKRQLSTNGGSFPTWVPGTSDLVFMDPTGQLMAVHYTVHDNVFDPDQPRTWARVRVAPGAAGRMFAIASADQFVFLAPPASETQNIRNDVSFVLNFPETLRIIAPRK